MSIPGSPLVVIMTMSERAMAIMKMLLAVLKDLVKVKRRMTHPLPKKHTSQRTKKMIPKTWGMNGCCRDKHNSKVLFEISTTHSATNLNHTIFGVQYLTIFTLPGVGMLPNARAPLA